MSLCKGHKNVGEEPSGISSNVNIAFREQDEKKIHAKDMIKTKHAVLHSSCEGANSVYTYLNNC